MIARRIWTLDVTKLALKTEIHHLIYVLRLQLFGVHFRVFVVRAVAVDGVEHLGKATAKFYAHSAVGAEAENALDFRTQIGFVKISRVRGIVCRIITHKGSPSNVECRPYSLIS